MFPYRQSIAALAATSICLMSTVSTLPGLGVGRQR